MRKIINPLTGKLSSIPQVLKDLAAQENCDGEPYDQMVEAAEHINSLEKLIEAYAVQVETLDRAVTVLTRLNDILEKNNG